VDHAGLVNRLQRLRQTPGHRQPLARCQRSTLVHLLVERAARHEARHQVRLLPLQIVVEDAGHPRVAHFLQCGRFALQPRACDRVMSDVWSQHLQRDLLMLGPLGQVDDAHAALPEPPDQPVRPDALFHLLHRGGRRSPCH
jgi:hypothetical protein